MDQTSQQNPRGDIRLVEPAGNFLGRQAIAIAEAEGLTLFVRQGGQGVVQSLRPLVADDGLRGTGQARGQQGNEILAPFASGDIARDFSAGGPLARGEVAVPIHDALLGQVAQPVEWVAVAEVDVRQFAEGFDGQILEDVLRFDLPS